MKNVKGYQKNKITLKYQVRFMIRNQLIYGGSYDTEEEAHQAFLRGRKFYQEQAKNTEGRL